MLIIPQHGQNVKHIKNLIRHFIYCEVITATLNSTQYSNHYHNDDLKHFFIINFPG